MFGLGQKNIEEEVAAQNQEAAASGNPEQPPIDNNHVAEGSQKFDEPKTDSESPIVNFEHRFAHFRVIFEERLHDLVAAFQADYKKLIEEFTQKVHGAE